jgi:flavoprotein
MQNFLLAAARVRCMLCYIGKQCSTAVVSGAENVAMFIRLNDVDAVLFIRRMENLFSRLNC